jgi:predicted nucleotide modification protein, DUF1599 family
MAVKDPQYLNEAFEKVLAEMLATFIKKNKDYGKDNILDTGELGIAFRVNDKVRRLQNLLDKKQQPKNECIDETWLDIAVYSIIAIILRNGQFEKLKLDPKV